MARLTTMEEYRAMLAEQPDHTVRNSRNQRAGQSFEDTLAIYHATVTDLATVMKTNPKIRVTGPGRAVVIGKGEVDYIAFLCDGRVVHFDAKSRAGDAYSLGADAAHQTQWLRTQADYGHIAGYLVNWSDYNLVTWHSIGTIEKRVRMRDGLAVDGVKWLELFLAH